ncbi:CheY-like chemotaxis protein [Dyadobacter sp. BE34]|uniref:CheY-like chemotaxis protein n=1 Tax=Dyadobacter fermentans TaxID=94254 RepID=A0ABU1R231_9BACT|nr:MULTISPECIES: response regulator [Dyadobacter]MDR6807462.1 CheY-like chemotaxis protein [Dyadobacter fermentans]MDR7045203.1 CheY-like chemotaxis protein [Dyadobacter sp. BE242]MDR7199060.1 CheY-like chemotaxis protein [Dyadobacter sp. BE34]MDR7217020.1 CheY-like chemotaxis protein [Dyadobacter sp. BE31]MDR7264953.1 CheY-like chemotaxis protein [Dyadobacter sp. BE32]
MEPLLNFFLIDDSAFDLFIYEKLLIKSGITNSVKTFNSARDALKHLIAQAESLPDTIILLDLQMPDMNGFEFIDEFDQLPETLRQKIRIFMLSSTIDTRDIEKAKASQHIIDLLPKPLEIPFLKKKLAI